MFKTFFNWLAEASELPPNFTTFIRTPKVSILYDYSRKRGFFQSGKYPIQLFESLIRKAYNKGVGGKTLLMKGVGGR